MMPFVFDGYGTLYNRGDYVYLGAKEWFMELRRAGKELRLVTNAASDVDVALAKSAADRGFDFTASETISSGSLLAATAKEIRESGRYNLREVFYIGRETGKNVLGACGITAVENPVEPIVAVSSSTATPEMFKHAVDVLSHKHALLLVLNPDAWAPNIDGSRSPVSGALVNNSFELWSGSCLSRKPSRNLGARAQTLPTGSRVLMVGDTLGTDVFGARVAGLTVRLLWGGMSLKQIWLPTRPPSIFDLIFIWCRGRVCRGRARRFVCNDDVQRVVYDNRVFYKDGVVSAGCWFRDWLRR
jgi:Predicted sugar phosphatases of the HAD superfamily